MQLRQVINELTRTQGHADEMPSIPPETRRESSKTVTTIKLLQISTAAWRLRSALVMSAILRWEREM